MPGQLVVEACDRMSAALVAESRILNNSQFGARLAVWGARDRFSVSGVFKEDPDRGRIYRDGWLPNNEG